MSPYYYNELPTAVMDEEAMIILGVMLIFLGVVALCGLVGWILSSLSLHSIAKRRGICHAWLAWLPIGSEWVLGSISDQYQHLVQGKVTSRRKLLIFLSVANIVIGIVYVVFTVMAEFLAASDGNVGGMLAAVGVPYLLFLGAYIAMTVFYHICNYDLYRSCKPQSAVVFLVLGIIIPVCQPFFYFSCRKRDLGMTTPAPVTPEPPELPRATPEF